MKKFVAPLLTLTMFMGAMATSVFAEDYTTAAQAGSITLSNVVATEFDLENNPNIFACEDQTVVTVNEDIYWLNLYLLDGEDPIPLSYDMTYSDENLPIFDIDHMSVIMTDTNKTYTMADYMTAATNGELDYQNDPCYIPAGSSFVMLVPEETYILEPIPLVGTESEFVCVVTSDFDGIPTVLDDTTAPTTPIAPTPATAAPTAASIVVDGEAVAFDAYNIADNNYFKLRDIAYILDGTQASFEVTWNQDAQAIEMLSSQSYTAVGGEMIQGDGSTKDCAPSTATIYLDGQEIILTAYTVNDNNYFKLRDLGEALGFNVSWDQDAQTIVVASDEAYTAD